MKTADKESDCQPATIYIILALIFIAITTVTVILPVLTAIMELV